MVGNKNVPFGIAVGAIVLVAGIALAGVYCQSVSFSDVDPVVAPVVKPQVASEETVTTKTLRSDAYGLEFTYSPEWGDIKDGEDLIGLMENDDDLMENDDWIFYLLTGENLTLTQKNPKRGEYEVDFYDIPKGTAVEDWIIKKQGKTYVEEGDGYFFNKIGQVFDIAGLETLHLVHRQGSEGGSYSALDEFYFVKDGRLFALTIKSDPSTREELKLDDDSQWYTQLLKSFRAVDAQ